MRALVVVRSGPCLGRAGLVQAGRTLRVGRSEVADLSIDGDPRISGAHLEVRVEGDAVVIEDLQSTNGTWRGSERVAKEVLREGEVELTVGDTRIAVSALDAAKPADATAADVAAPREAPPLEPVARPAEPEKRQRVTVEPVREGLVRVCPVAPALEVDEIAARLDRSARRHLLVDYGRAELSPPEGTASLELLERPPEAVGGVAPLLLSQQAEGEPPAIPAEAWGRDALVCIYSDDDGESVRDRYRRVVQVSEREQTVLGAFWPSLLSLLLQNGEPATVDALVEGVRAFLIEDVRGDEPSWQLFARPEELGDLADLGFDAQPEA